MALLNHRRRPRRGNLQGLAALLTAGAVVLATAATATAIPVGAPVAPPNTIAGWGANGSGQGTGAVGNDFTAIAAGGEHSIALTSDGTIKAWGSNTSGQTNAPTDSGYTAIAAGVSHSLALTSNGTIKAWGNNGEGQTNAPTDSGYTAIAAGHHYSLALTSNGTIKAWGSNTSGQTNAPRDSGYTAIAGGWLHSLALTSDGTIKTWGNVYGELSDNLPGGSGYKAVAAGSSFSMALTADGTVKVWGQNFFDENNAPPGNGYIAIAAGSGHALALTADGTVKAWGYSGDGRTNAPTSSGHTAIAAGQFHSMALRSVPPAAPAFADTTPVTVDGVVGIALNRTFAVTGYPTPTLTATGLPAEITLSPAGVLTGTPTTTGPVPFTITADNDLGSATLNVTLNVAAAPAAPAFADTAAVALDGVVGTSLTREFAVTGNPTPIVSVVDDTKLPLGMKFINGVLSGTPTTADTYNFTLKAASSTAPDATLDVTVTVAAAPSAPAFTDAGPIILNGIVGEALDHTFAAIGNPTPTFTYSALPTWSSLDAATGALSGTPTAPGQPTFTITATNDLGSATVNVTLNVAAARAAPMFTDAGPVTGTALTREFTVAGNPVPTITVEDPIKLPTGMTFINGVLSGTPTTAGEYTFVLNAVNGVNPDLTLTVIVKVTDAPITPEPPTTGSVQFFEFGS